MRTFTGGAAVDRPSLHCRALLRVIPRPWRLVSRVAAAGSTQASSSQEAVTALVLDGRRTLEQNKSSEAFAIAGVTFGGRQELVRGLQPDQVVLLEREPWNDYDPAAVGVLDLQGRALGFVPRRDGLNARFKYERSFGVIASAGPAAGSGNYGARVYGRPDLPSVMLDPLPRVLADSARFTDMPALFGDRWPLLQSTALAAAGHRCEVTGLSPSQLPLQVLPQWRYNPTTKAAQLMSLMTLCQPLAEAKAKLEQGLVAAAATAAGNDALAAAQALRKLAASLEGSLIAEVNGVYEADVVQYFGLLQRFAQAALRDGWKVEVLL